MSDMVRACPHCGASKLTEGQCLLCNEKMLNTETATGMHGWYHAKCLERFDKEYFDTSNLQCPECGETAAHIFDHNLSEQDMYQMRQFAAYSASKTCISCGYHLGLLLTAGATYPTVAGFEANCVKCALPIFPGLHGYCKNYDRYYHYPLCVLVKLERQSLYEFYARGNKLVKEYKSWF
jgi:hypothetical protein